MARAKKPKVKKKSGPKGVRIAIEPKMMEGFGRCFATLDEVADVMGCDRTTITKRMIRQPELRDAYDRGKAMFQLSQRRTNIRHAQMPSSAGVTMSIFLSKVHLGMSDQPANAPNGAPIPVTDSASERIAANLDRLFESFVKANEARIIEHEPSREAGGPAEAVPKALPGQANGSAKPKP